MTKIDEPDGHWFGGPDDLHGTPVDDTKIGAQDFVPAHDLTYAQRQGAGNERFRRAQCSEKIQCRITRVKMLEQPKSLLSER